MGFGKPIHPLWPGDLHDLEAIIPSLPLVRKGKQGGGAELVLWQGAEKPVSGAGYEGGPGARPAANSEIRSMPNACPLPGSISMTTP